MNAKKPAFLALAIVVIASVTSAAETTWPTNSASDLSVFVTLQRFRIYADQCSDKVPGLKPQFDSVMESLSSHINGIAKSVLSSNVFRGMKTAPVPAAISFAFKDSLEDARHNFERQDADVVCPTKLQSLGKVDDDTLRFDLTQTLLAVQSMIKNLEKEGAREASPDGRMQQSGSP
jgi:hypothetical protein